MVALETARLGVDPLGKLKPSFGNKVRSLRKSLPQAVGELIDEHANGIRNAFAHSGASFELTTSTVTLTNEHFEWQGSVDEAASRLLRMAAIANAVQDALLVALSEALVDAIFYWSDLSAFVPLLLEAMQHGHDPNWLDARVKDLSGAFLSRLRSSRPAPA